MKFLPFILLTLAAAAPARADNCIRFENQTLEDAAANAIMDGWVDHSTANLACLKELVAKGADLKKKGSWGSDQSSVNLAAHAGRPEIMEYILSQGVDIGAMTDERTALELGNVAAIGGSVEIMKMLQARGLPINFKNPAWGFSYMKPANYFLGTCSPELHEAIDFVRADLVTYLISQGVNVNARCGGDLLFMSEDNGIPTPLHSLAYSTEAIDNLNGDVKGRRVQANAIIKILVDAGADLKAREDIHGYTAARLLLQSNWISDEMKAYVKAHQ